MHIVWTKQCVLWAYTVVYIRKDSTAREKKNPFKTKTKMHSDEIVQGYKKF